MLTNVRLFAFRLNKLPLCGNGDIDENKKTATEKKAIIR